jgi:hypothetical protein
LSTPTRPITAMANRIPCTTSVYSTTKH